MFSHPLARSSSLQPRSSHLPVNHRLPLGLRLPPAEAGDEATGGELARDRTLAGVEAALFLADEPLTPRKLAVVAGLTDAAEARRQVARLRDLYRAGGSAFQVEELGGGYQLLTRPEFHPWLSRLRKPAPETQLSNAARETLAMIAYRQPITRADIEAIRGVGSTDVLKQLMEKGLVKLAGRDSSLGRPALYETTKRFLQVFGLRSAKELPPGDGLFGPRAEKGDKTDDSEG